MTERRKTEQLTEQIRNKSHTGLDLLTAGGADQARCRIAYSETNEINVEDGKFSLYRTMFDTTAAFMAICGGRRGIVQSNQVGDEHLRATAAECLGVAESAAPDEAWQLAPDIGARTVTTGALEYEEDRFYARLVEFLDTVAERYPTVVISALSGMYTRERACSVYSTGTQVESLAGYYSVDITFNAVEDGVSSSFNYTGIKTDNLDTPFIEQGSFAANLSDITREVRTEAYKNTRVAAMILTPTAFESFLYDIVGNFIGDTPLIDGSSIWKDRLGETVADPRLTLRLAPRDERVVAGRYLTAEGYLVEDYACIEDGVLKQFVLSDYAARKTGRDRAPNTEYNFIVTPGDIPLADLIAGIDHGILVNRFSGGSPSRNGDFSGVAKNSFLIENGKITTALRETMISGNLAAMLKEVRGISSETVADGNRVLPWIALDGITLSGEQAAPSEERP